jgi:chemotaxis protein methyltransferase CheR
MRSKHGLSAELLEQFSGFVAAEMGLHFPPERRAELERALGEAARAFGCRDAEECLRRMLAAPLSRQQVETLAAHLTVGETYFFREQRVYEILEARILPELIQARRGERRLRLWSAACASGEEPYSLAILLDRLLPDLDEWNVTLLATDINPASLRKAAEGVYREWSFRRMPEGLRERYFREVVPGQYELDARIRRLVTFDYLNLAADSYPSLVGNTNAMDVIFCRNVLLYFTPERVRQTIENLRRCLVDGGWLAVSQTEVSHLHFTRFETVNFPDAILYRKADGRDGASVAVAPEPSPEAAPELALELFLPHEAEPVLPPPSPAPEPPEAVAPPVETPLLPAAADAAETSARRARECADRGELDAAAEWCEKAVAADKLNARHHYLAAAVAQERGRFDEARESLRRALFLEPDFALAHFALGNVASRQGRGTEADRHYANALRLLAAREPDETLPEGEGLTVGWLAGVLGAARLRGGG